MKRNYLTTLLLNLAILASTASFGQQNNIDLENCRQGESVEYCKEHKILAELLKDPAFKKSWEQDRATLALEQEQLLEKSKKEVPGKGVVYRIPVVFHVLHNGGPENISKEQIINALEVWNRDFRRLNADADNVHTPFQGMPSDVEIEFVLATKAPNGTCFSGITRTQSTLSYDGSNGGAQVDAIVAGNDVFNGQWPGNKYLNIFVCGEIGGAAGYTYRPSSWPGTSMKNGIWILHNYVGAIGTSSPNTSRTLTHESGHWLDLPHCWGSTNNPGLASNCNTDDGISDTPNTIGVTACILNESSCGPIANVENYMDYSYCSKMFTAGQVLRMRTALNASVGGRNNLATAANIAATGADSNLYICKAEFNVDRRVICAGESVDFSDASYNAVSGWTWNFPGGSPSSSSAQNPSVTYNTPGTYNVSLAATDGTGSQSTTKTAYITVLPAGTMLPYVETFENYSTLAAANSFWTANNPGNNEAFEVSNTAGASGTKSLRLRNFTQTAGNEDEIVSDLWDLSNFSAGETVTLSFKYASRKRNTSNYESLRILVSNDCGASFISRKSINGTQLTSEVVTSEWTPTAQDWVQVHVTNITDQYFVNNLKVMFRFTSGGGNNFFLDDINFYQGGPENLGVLEAGLVNNLQLFPNPADQEVNVSFEAAAAGTVDLEVRDLTGKVVRTQRIQASAGSNLVMMGTGDLASGMYFLNMKLAGQQQTLQFVVR